MSSRPISNQQAYEFYRRAIEASLSRPVPLIDTGEEWGRQMQIAARWQARYSRRRDFIQGEEGWGHKLQDTLAVEALIARSLAKEAEWSLLPMWDERTRLMVERSLQFVYQTGRIDVASLGERCRFGPSLRRLWGQARAQGMTENDAWQAILAWADYQPPGWSRDDERARHDKTLEQASLADRNESIIVWTKTRDLQAPWVAEHQGDQWQVRLNDFPDDHMYSLIVNGQLVGDFDNWPDAWARGDRRPTTLSRKSATISKQAAPVQFLERYIAGEHEAVWAELVGLGNAVRQPAYYPEALAVARETMRRARRNVELVIQRLDKFGYRFWDGKPQSKARSRNHLKDKDVFLPPGPHEKKRLDELEHNGMVLPLSLRMWMEQVGRVDLTGSHPALCFLEHEEDFVGIYADPLMVIPNAESAEEMLGLATDRDHALFISHDDWGKAAVGTNELLDSSYNLEVPNQAADGFLQGERHGIYFVDYLRLSFRWGGFPGWEKEAKRPERELAALTDGLLPL